MPTGQLTYLGETRSLPGWARHLGLPYKTLWARLASGWPLERAFRTPVPCPRTTKAPPPRGIAPHIAGPAIALGGQWVPIAVWQQAHRQEEDAP